MRLNCATLSNPMQKMGGHGGTGGTACNNAAFSRPTLSGRLWDTVGHSTPTMAQSDLQPAEMSHLSHDGKKEVGRCKPCIHAAVPPVPPVPPKNSMSEIDREAFEERAAIMEFDGALSRAEAERLAAESLGLVKQAPQ